MAAGVVLLAAVIWLLRRRSGDGQRRAASRGRAGPNPR